MLNAALERDIQCKRTVLTHFVIPDWNGPCRACGDRQEKKKKTQQEDVECVHVSHSWSPTSQFLAIEIQSALTLHSC